MAGVIVDTSYLGAHELQLHQRLEQTYHHARELVDTIRAPSTPMLSVKLTGLERQIKELMAKMRENIRDLELSSEEQDTDEETQAVEVCLRAHKSEYESLRQALASAQVTVRQRSEALFAHQRKELLAGASVAQLQRQYKTEGDLVSGAQDITSGLMRTRQVLSQQLEQNAGNLELLDTGNAVLSKAKDELHGQKELFQESKHKLGTLKRQAMGDRWLLWLGLIVFLCVAAFVGYKRAPAPVRMPVDVVLRLGYKGGSFAMQQAHNGIILAVRRAQDMAKKPAQDSSGGQSQDLEGGEPPWPVDMDAYEAEIGGSDLYRDQDPLQVIEHKDASPDSFPSLNQSDTSLGNDKDSCPDGTCSAPAAADGEEAFLSSLSMRSGDQHEPGDRGSTAPTASSDLAGQQEYGSSGASQADDPKFPGDQQDPQGAQPMDTTRQVHQGWNMTLDPGLDLPLDLPALGPDSTSEHVLVESAAPPASKEPAEDPESEPSMSSEGGTVPAEDAGLPSSEPLLAGVTGDLPADGPARPAGGSGAERWKDARAGSRRQQQQQQAAGPGSRVGSRPRPGRGSQPQPVEVPEEVLSASQPVQRAGAAVPSHSEGAPPDADTAKLPPDEVLLIPDELHAAMLSQMTAAGYPADPSMDPSMMVADTGLDSSKVHLDPSDPEKVEAVPAPAELPSEIAGLEAVSDPIGGKAIEGPEGEAAEGLKANERGVSAGPVLPALGTPQPGMGADTPVSEVAPDALPVVAQAGSGEAGVLGDVHSIQEEPVPDSAPAKAAEAEDVSGEAPPPPGSQNTSGGMLAAAAWSDAVPEAPVGSGDEDGTSTHKAAKAGRHVEAVAAEDIEQLTADGSESRAADADVEASEQAQKHVTETAPEGVEAEEAALEDLSLELEEEGTAEIPIAASEAVEAGIVEVDVLGHVGEAMGRAANDLAARRQGLAEEALGKTVEEIEVVVKKKHEGVAEGGHEDKEQAATVSADSYNEPTITGSTAPNPSPGSAGLTGPAESALASAEKEIEAMLKSRSESSAQLNGPQVSRSGGGPTIEASILEVSGLGQGSLPSSRLDTLPGMAPIGELGTAPGVTPGSYQGISSAASESNVLIAEQSREEERAERSGPPPGSRGGGEAPDIDSAPGLMHDANLDASAEPAAVIPDVESADLSVVQPVAAAPDAVEAKIVETMEAAGSSADPSVVQPATAALDAAAAKIVEMMEAAGSSADPSVVQPVAAAADAVEAKLVKMMEAAGSSADPSVVQPATAALDAAAAEIVEMMEAAGSSADPSVVQPATAAADAVEAKIMETMEAAGSSADPSVVQPATAALDAAAAKIVEMMEAAGPSIDPIVVQPATAALDAAAAKIVEMMEVAGSSADPSVVQPATAALEAVEATGLLEGGVGGAEGVEGLTEAVGPSADVIVEASKEVEQVPEDRDQEAQAIA